MNAIKKIANLANRFEKNLHKVANAKTPTLGDEWKKNVAAARGKPDFNPQHWLDKRKKQLDNQVGTLKPGVYDLLMEEAEKFIGTERAAIDRASQRTGGRPELPLSYIIQEQGRLDGNPIPTISSNPKDNAIKIMQESNVENFIRLLGAMNFQPGGDFDKLKDYIASEQGKQEMKSMRFAPLAITPEERAKVMLKYSLDSRRLEFYLSIKEAFRQLGK